jgi:hypothetical protein
MAIYHCSIKIISRGKGRSAVAAAAYRSGESIMNEYDGIMHDYTRKGGIEHTEILLPENAPDEYHDRATLWNAVEKSERAKNAQLAREIEIALPVELTREQNIELVRDYISRNFVVAGMCADICIHDKNDGNPHAHIMLTMRSMDRRGEWAAKSKKEYLTDENGERIRLKSGNYKTRKVSMTDWNEQTKAEEWRAAWAKAVNDVFESQNIETRIDHRSYERQGVDQIPTITLGVSAHQMERLGIRTERGDVNREIEISNAKLRQLKARIVKLEKWLEAEAKADAPTLSDVLSEILKGGESRTRYGKIRDLKAAAGVLSFLQSNRISTIEELHGVVKGFYEKQSDISGKLKPIERRLKTVDVHIRQAETLAENKAVYRQYMAQKPKNKEAFREIYRAEITLYEAADRYLNKHLNGRTAIPLKKWRAERGKLTAERSMLYGKYKTLRSKIREVETLYKAAKSISQAIAPPRMSREKGLTI